MSRVLTTHSGSLPRPDDLIARFQRGDAEPAIAPAVADVVRRQVDTGIDIVNDGEYGKPVDGPGDYAAFMNYRHARIGGFELVEVEDEEFLIGRDRRDYAEFYAGGEATMNPTGKQVVGLCTGPITYIGHGLLARDIANLAAARAGAGTAGAFMACVSPDLPRLAPDGHYTRVEDAELALAEALGEEYRLIADAGLMVQIDDARMAATYEGEYSIGGDLAAFRSWAARRVELLNHALTGVPREQVRYHMCWGSWKGPHSSDLPLADVIDLLLRIDASQYLIEASNPQHEHEWAVWADRKLPDGTIVIPGVVTHKTNVMEHPEVVAQRLERFAGAVGRENVIAGTDCGMGGRIHPQLAWGKLRALVDGAELASARLWK